MLTSVCRSLYLLLLSIGPRRVSSGWLILLEVQELRKERLPDSLSYGSNLYLVAQHSLSRGQFQKSMGIGDESDNVQRADPEAHQVQTSPIRSSQQRSASGASNPSQMLSSEGQAYPTSSQRGISPSASLLLPNLSTTPSSKTPSPIYPTSRTP